MSRALAAIRERRDRKDDYRKTPVELEACREWDRKPKDRLEKLEIKVGWVRR